MLLTVSRAKPLSRQSHGSCLPVGGCAYSEGTAAVQDSPQGSAEPSCSALPFCLCKAGILYTLYTSPSCKPRPCSHPVLQMWLWALYSPISCSASSQWSGKLSVPCDEAQLFFAERSPSSWMTRAVLNKDNHINEVQDLLLLEATSNRF